MRQLWLLRHAKAAADPPPGGTDHERPLSPRGRSDAAALGHRLREQRPAYTLCSTAARAVETAELVLVGMDVVLDRRRSLYHAGPDDVMRELRTLPDEVRSVVVVGHNPTIQELALDLLAPGDTGGRATLEAAGFPTCALACYRLDAQRWRDAAPATATLTGFFAPPY